MEKKISVVIPVFNGEERIQKAIESVVSQTYSNLEIIVVNDCSTDGTRGIVEKLSAIDDRIIIINNEVNMKLPKSLNIGFERASGEYLTWTSDDNLYHTDALQTLADCLDSDPYIDLVYSDFSIKNMDGSLVTHIHAGGPEMIPFINPVGACFLYRKAIAEVVGGYDPTMFLAEDYDYWIRIFINGRIKHISKDLYDYGRHDKSLTATRMADIKKQTFTVKAKYEKELLKHCMTQRDRNKFYDSQLEFLGDKTEFRKVRAQYYKQDRRYMLNSLWERFKLFPRMILHGDKTPIKE